MRPVTAGAGDIGDCSLPGNSKGLDSDLTDGEAVDRLVELDWEAPRHDDVDRSVSKRQQASGRSDGNLVRREVGGELRTDHHIRTKQVHVDHEVGAHNWFALTPETHGDPWHAPDRVTDPSFDGMNIKDARSTRSAPRSVIEITT